MNLNPAVQKPLIAWKGEFEQKEGTNVNLGESAQNIPDQKAEIKFLQNLQLWAWLIWFAVFLAGDPETILCLEGERWKGCPSTW